MKYEVISSISVPAKQRVKWKPLTLKQMKNLDNIIKRLNIDSGYAPVLEDEA
jgi:hypothetical protein